MSMFPAAQELFDMQAPNTNSQLTLWGLAASGLTTALSTGARSATFSVAAASVADTFFIRKLLTNLGYVVSQSGTTVTFDWAKVYS